MPATTYRRNESLPTVRAGYPGNQLIGKEFVNVGGLYEPQWSTLLRWLLTANPQKEEKKKDTWAPAVVPCAEAFSPGQPDMLVWLGHAGFLLRVGGVSMLFDPVLFSSTGLRHRHPLPCRPEEVLNLDYLLLSHAHRDHLDEQTIKLLARQNPRMQVLGPLGVTGLLRGWVPGLPVQEAGWWQRFDLPNTPFELYYLPASHWSRRWLWDTNEILWGSFLLKTADRTIYFGGDSSYAPHFEQIEETFGPLDIVLLPIGAYKPPFMMGQSHMNPHEAAKAANVLRAGHLVPMHYGTFDLSNEPASEPLRLIEAATTGGMLRGELHAPAVGEVLDWTRWE